MQRLRETVACSAKRDVYGKGPGKSLRDRVTVMNVYRETVAAEHGRTPVTHVNSRGQGLHAQDPHETEPEASPSPSVDA